MEQALKTKLKFIPNRAIIRILVAFVSLFCFASAQASLIMTYVEQPGVQSSTVTDTSVFNFDSLPTGKLSQNVNFLGVGTINQVYVIPANQYGGAADAAYPNGSPYSVESSSSSLGGNVNATLTLNSPSAYFGMWWSAGDPANYLYFYSGTNLVGEFDTKWLDQKVGKSYYGNPVPGSNKGADSGEAFAFINFYATGGATFDKIVMSNPGGSGFESDNWTVRAPAYGTVSGDGSTLPGVPVETVNGTNVTVYSSGTVAVSDSGAPLTSVASVPEPGLWQLILIGGIIGLVWQRREQFARKLC